MPFVEKSFTTIDGGQVRLFFWDTYLDILDLSAKHFPLVMISLTKKSKKTELRRKNKQI